VTESFLVLRAGNIQQRISNTFALIVMKTNLVKKLEKLREKHGLVVNTLGRLVVE